MSIRRNLCLLIGSLLACIPAFATTPKMDFNNDGHADLAIAAPDADLVSRYDVDGYDKFDAGSVTILYGSSRGLLSAGSQLWTMDHVLIPGVAGHFEQFGKALEAGDFNGDGYTDLAIGVPGMGVYPYRAGTVVVLYGSAAGLTSPPCSGLCLAQTFKMESPQPADAFGSALASGDFDHDGKADLAVGAWGYDVGDVANAGAVRILYGSSNGLTSSNSQVLTLNMPGIGKTLEVNERFGSALAAGNLGKGIYADLAIGIPLRTSVGGAVSVIYGTANGLSPIPINGTGGHSWRPAGLGVYGYDFWGRFGESLAIGNFDGASVQDLAIGVPGHDIGEFLGAGAVLVVYGTESGSNGSVKLWTFELGGGEGLANDWFGASLAAGDFGYGGESDLAIGMPYRMVAGIPIAGAVFLLFGGTSGLSASNSEMLVMDRGQLQRQAEFGNTLSAAAFGGDSYDDLAIAMPGWPGIVNNAATNEGAVSIRYGSATGPGPVSEQIWNPDSAGVPGTSQIGAKFGGALSK